MSFVEGVSPDLLRAAAWVFLFGFLLLSRDLPLRYAALIAFLKVLIPLVYFAQDPSGTIHLRDDLGYYYNALREVQKGAAGVWLYVTSVLPVIVQTAQVPHVVYNLWNILALSALGPHYFAPVFFNVGLTFVAGYSMYRILRRLEFSQTYSRFALAFFLLHFDTVAWSSFLNLKDILVMTVTVVVLHQFVRGLQAGKAATLLLALVWASLGIFCLFYLRFYVPFVLMGAFLVHLFWRGRVAPAALLAAALLAVGVWKHAAFLNALQFVKPLDIVTGLPRFLLTPLPWNLSLGYEFLLLPSIFYLILIVPAFLSLPTLWGWSRDSKLPLIYLAIIVLLYASIPDLQGPRQRYQASFVLIWMQFHALWAFARYALPQREPLAANAPEGEPAAESHSG